MQEKPPKKPSIVKKILLSFLILFSIAMSLVGIIFFVFPFFYLATGGDTPAVMVGVPLGGLFIIIGIVIFVLILRSFKKMSQLEKQEFINNKENVKRKLEKSSTSYNILAYIFFGVIILGILAYSLLVFSGNKREEEYTRQQSAYSNNSKRFSDLDNMTNILNQYKEKYGAFPIVNGFEPLQKELINKGFTAISEDPIYPKQKYRYGVSSDGKYFRIDAEIENDYYRTSFMLNEHDGGVDDKKLEIGNAVKENKDKVTCMDNCVFNNDNLGKINTTINLNCPENYKEYISTILGVGFCYPEKVGDSSYSSTVKVTEVDEKIYVYYDTITKEQGQFVEVFDKEKTDTLVQAIEKQFLQGISKDKCWAVLATTPSGAQNFFNAVEYPKSYIFAQALKYPMPENPAYMSEAFANADNCPADYRSTNGIRSFMMDQNNPDRFFFFNIGQYSIAGTNQPTWQETIKILGK